MSDINDNDKSDEKVSCEKQFVIAGITAGGDLQKDCHVLKKNKVVIFIRFLFHFFQFFIK